MRAIVTVLGKDRVGIMSLVCALLAQHNVNILDISQTILQEDFTMVMLVDAGACDIPFGQLAALLGMSRTPVREALRRLEQDDLVESRGKTIVVVGVTHQDLLDMLEIRLRLEGLATAMCCQRIGQKELVELDEIVTLQEFYVSRDLPDKILESDSRFHTAIYAACGSRVFDKQLTGLLKRLMRHRKLSVSDNQRAQKSTAEHRAIFNALAAGDAAQAEALATQHVERARDNILINEQAAAI